MRLRQLEIKGFKSFANETRINFSEDVIGIVGPNGSGKSNIVDAIRWVLGEQKSRELRLDTMSSAARDPFIFQLPAASFRRIFRSPIPEVLLGNRRGPLRQLSPSP